MKLAGYLRNGIAPALFCPGCGHGILMMTILRAVELPGINEDDLLFVSGIGCAGWIPNPNYNADSMHVTHGRPIPFATGAKLANPRLKVIVISGDGDLASIGGNHLIHAARRNVDITVICADNNVYAMTGGQVSSLSAVGKKTRTTPHGNKEASFDLCELVSVAGASYSARFFVGDRKLLLESLVEAMTTDGFSFIDVISPCPTDIKRDNSSLSRYDSIMELKNSIEPVSAINAQDRGANKIFTGVYKKNMDDKGVPK